MKKLQMITGRGITGLALGALLLAGVVVVGDAAGNNDHGRGSGRGSDGYDGRCGNGRGGGFWGSRFGNLEVVGLTADQRLICFDENDPGRANTIGKVTGLTADVRLVGIDFRPATGELYGLGNAGGVYTLNLDTAAATFRSRLNVTLAGTFF